MATLLILRSEALLAQAVLRGRTKGYRNHPQLTRFRAQPDPPASIAAYLRAIHEEATARGYRFDGSRIAPSGPVGRIDLTDGQITFEWTHLMKKIADRAPELRERWGSVNAPCAHPLFRVVEGAVADWERP